VAFAAAQHLPEEDPALVFAIVEQESGWDPNEYRYEPAFEKKYVDGIEGLSETEKKGRSMSWGLMQLMGQVARERGFIGPFPKLCSLPSENLRFGCLHLRSMLARADRDVEQALLNWNGGANPDYGRQVIARMSRYKP
jgi:soluble lytic murein transglycosylase-like protein